MSTTAVIPGNTIATPPIKNENINFAVVVTLNEEGKIDPKKVRHTSSVADINSLKGLDKDGKPVAGGYTGAEQIAFEQTVVKPSVGTEEGFAELIPDADVRLDIINKGIAAKFNQKIRTTLIELDSEGNLAFQPVEPTYDATSLVQAPSERVTLSPVDRALKALGGLSPDALAAVMAQFAALNSNKSSEAAE